MRKEAAENNSTAGFAPEIPEEEIEVSYEDLQFVNENLEYAGFLSKLDTHSITKYALF